MLSWEIIAQRIKWKTNNSWQLRKMKWKQLFNCNEILGWSNWNNGQNVRQFVYICYNISHIAECKTNGKILHLLYTFLHTLVKDIQYVFNHILKDYLSRKLIPKRHLSKPLVTTTGRIFINKRDKISIQKACII